jgi:hypothetical protein
MAYIVRMSRRPHTVAELPQFIRDADAAGLSDEEPNAVIDSVALNPRGGDLVQGSGGVRKVRVAGRGKGKSGGFRVMKAYIGERAPVYLVAMLSKGSRGNFSPSEVAAMKSIVTQIKQAFRE